jgi:hypothetical protein
MITFTELELVLFVGFVVMTFLYFKMRAELHIHKCVTIDLMSRIASGRMKVIETDDGFNFEDIKS